MDRQIFRIIKEKTEGCSFQQLKNQMMIGDPNVDRREVRRVLDGLKSRNFVTVYKFRHFITEAGFLHFRAVGTAPGAVNANDGAGTSNDDGGGAIIHMNRER